MSNQLDISQLFELVTQTLGQKREELNAADKYNHDHGDHVLEVFELITQVAKENPHLEAAEILERASELLRQKQTGTAQAYAQTIAEGAKNLRGKPITQGTIPLLMQALLGSAQGGAPAQQAPAQSQPAGGLGGLLGALMGGGQSSDQPASSGNSGGGDLLGGLLGALAGGGSSQGNSSSGIGLDDLMRAGSALLQASQGGKSSTEAALNALAASTGVGQTPHRAESAKVVMQALMQAAQMMDNK